MKAFNRTPCSTNRQKSELGSGEESDLAWGSFLLPETPLFSASQQLFLYFVWSFGGVGGVLFDFFVCLFVLFNAVAFPKQWPHWKALKLL